MHVSLRDRVTRKRLFDSVSSKAGGERQALPQFKSDAFLPGFSFKRPVLFRCWNFTQEQLAVLNSNIHTCNLWLRLFAALHDVIQKQLEALCVDGEPEAQSRSFHLM